jgi:DNA polymerase III epsilon subunit-like protein
VWNDVRSNLADRLVCGYNIDFDIQMMRQSHARYKIPWIESFRKFDVLKLYAEFRGEWNAVHRSFRFYKLEDARNDLKIPEINTHRALDDALTVRVVLFKLACVES